MSSSINGARIGPIACVTISMPDLDAAAAAYGSHLGYRAIGLGRVSASQARLWGAPSAADARYLLMAPAAAGDFVFRFIETTDCGYRAFAGHGWNAAELIVSRVDPLAERLRHSPFEIVAPPLDLSFCSDIRAMQIRGPGGEILYLTEFKKPVPGLDAPPARCEVDSTFIVIVGGPSLTAMQAYYANQFGVPVTPAMESRVQTMALAFGLDREHRFRLAALPLRERCYVEADEMPAAARPLPAPGGDLPGGICIVSFRGDPGPGAEPALNSQAPYGTGTRVSCHRGAAGEIIEIIGGP